MRQKTLLKIMNLMRKDLTKGRTILDISKQLKIGYRPAYNHLTEMEKEGIIGIERIGSSKQCKLELNSPKTRHLLEYLDISRKEDIYIRNPKIKIVIESLILKLTGQFISEIHSIILFGSYAKGKATRQSDLDLLFIVTDMKNKELREAIDRECAGFSYSHNLKVSPLITDIGEMKKMLNSRELNVGKEIKDHGISLYGHEMFWRIIT